MNQTDVRWASDLTDDTGGIEAMARNCASTDRFNAVGGGGGTDPATVVDIPFPTGPINCTPTADPTVGADCNLSTTLEAMVPGAIPERKRAIVELGRIEMFDGGPDGQISTSPNTLFAVQGLFIP